MMWAITVVIKARVALDQDCGREIGCPGRLLSWPLYTRLGLKESISGYKGDHLIWLILVIKSAVSIHARTPMSNLLAGLLSSRVLGTLLRRSRGLTPSSVAPECL